jgi:hypothetical protein
VSLVREGLVRDNPKDRISGGNFGGD